MVPKGDCQSLFGPNRDAGEVRRALRVEEIYWTHVAWKGPRSRDL